MILKLAKGIEELEETFKFAKLYDINFIELDLTLARGLNYTLELL